MKQTFTKELSLLGPRSIAIDKNRHIWIGTREKGLYCFAYQNNQLQLLRHLTTKDGLTENFISYLYCDARNIIWACTPAGLDKLDQRDNNIHIENLTLSNNIFQNTIEVQATASGEYWVLTQGGMLRFTEKNKNVTSYKPGIEFRQVKAGEKNIINTKNLELDYEHNNLTFQLAAPTYIDEKLTRFSYLLEGSGKNYWSAASKESEINFINLSPGDYTLKVKASFLNGKYPETESAFSFVIHPPWWETWWFRILSGIILLSFVFLLVRFYYRKRIEVQQTIMERQQAIVNERTRIATDMHDDLGAGLSSIRFISERIKRNSFSEVTRQDIEKLEFTTGELMDKMNEIIWATNEKNDTVEDLVFYIRSYAKAYAEDNDLNCFIHIPDELPGLFVSGEVRRNIFLVVKESLHNIVKHANASSIDMDIRVGTKLYIHIKDDGTGIHPTESRRGGNGLHNMKKRMLDIGGSLDMENGSGLTLNISLPL
jgi:signal transduction histidine kinase